MYEEKFRKSLKLILNDRGLKHASVASKAGIKRDVFSKILNTERKIFAEEVGGICEAIGLTFEEVIAYQDSEEHQVAGSRGGEDDGYGEGNQTTESKSRRPDGIKSPTIQSS